MQKIKFSIICFMLVQIIFNRCTGQNVIISSNGHHGSVDCAASVINMQVDNPNPNYDYSWHYVFFDSVPGGGCEYDNYSTQIGTGISVNVNTNVGKIFAIECFADSGGMLWDASHWLRVRKPDLKVPLCINNTLSCGEKMVEIPEVFFEDSTGAFTQQWFKNGSQVNLNGSGLEILNSNGYYYLRVKVGTCGYAYSDSIHVTTTFPSAVITANGPVTFCSGGSVMLHAPVAASRAYQWQKGGVNISGATSSGYNATTSGSYKVRVTNTSTGCSKTTASATMVTVNPLPAAAISPSGTITFCAGQSAQLTASPAGAYTYQWKKNGTNINGATALHYAATSAGKYKVMITKTSTGCSKTSGNDTVVVPCREGEIVSIPIPVGIDFSIYPNPAHSEINILISEPGNFQAEIINTLGKRIARVKDQTKIDISSFAEGMYFVKVINGNNIVTQKFTKE